MITEEKFVQFLETIKPQIIANCEWPVPEWDELEWKEIVSGEEFATYADKAWRLDHSVSLYDYMANKVSICNEDLVAAIDAEIALYRDSFEVYYKARVACGEFDEDNENERDEEHDQWFEDIDIDFSIKLSFFEKGNALSGGTSDEFDLAKKQAHVRFYYDISIGSTMLSTVTIRLQELDGEASKIILDKLREIMQAPKKELCEFEEVVDLDGENLYYLWPSNFEIKPETKKILSEYAKDQARSIQKEKGVSRGYLVNTVNNYTFTGWWEINDK